MLDPKKTYVVELSSCGNPDHGQFYPLSKKEYKTITSLETAILYCKNYIEEHNLGGGNWTGGEIYELKGKRKYKTPVYISYNGRVWNGNMPIEI